MAVPIIAPKAASTPKALRTTNRTTSGTFSALSTITSAATSRYATAISGTTHSATRAMRRTPPTRIAPSTTSSAPVVVITGTFQARSPRW